MAEQYLKKNTRDTGIPPLERFKQTLPDKGHWQVPVPLTRNTIECCGSALMRNTPVTVYYYPKTGLLYTDHNR